MSDHIPFEIQVEILKRLPVKSLIQFRSVSKTWKSVIDSSDFVACYSTRTQHHMFVRYRYPGYEERFVSVVDDDDTFPLNIVSLNHPSCFSVGYYYCIVGCSHGLLCYYVDSQEHGNTVVIWNPSIRRAFDVAAPNVENKAFQTVLGFGVCRETNDPKIVRINFDDNWNDLLSVPCQVDVFTLSTRAWRSLHNNLPRKSVRFRYMDHNSYSVVIDGVVYWLASDWSRADDDGCSKLIISFDVTSEEFGEVDLRIRLSQGPCFLTMSKLRESLVVLDNVVEADRLVCNVWMMEGGVPKSFTKLFTFEIVTQVDEVMVMGFRQRGDPIVQLIEEDDSAQLVVYKTHSRQIDDLVGFDGVGERISMHPYMETLFLHDQPNLTQAVQS